jgi:hypothetical protein
MTEIEVIGVFKNYDEFDWVFYFLDAGSMRIVGL